MSTQNARSNKPNHLIDSLSPYLLQHAHNPVDWYPWSQETLQKARQENKPIFLSIGYSACHWCHVMEHDSFENAEIADLLNRNFISIKVDREERPDIDEIYMQATMAMTGSGGWPMSVFLTPDGVPFFCGTYFPRDQFKKLLIDIADAWVHRQDNINEYASKIQEHIQSWATASPSEDSVVSQELIHQTAKLLADHFDLKWGGLTSGHNKFPPGMIMELLLRRSITSQEPLFKQVVELTLDKMADGGIHDHLGGGFCRYSTDPQWLVPHFEKMLYDQALVSSAYLDGYLVFEKRRYAEVVRGILDFVIRDMQSPEGGFYSSYDADSEGLEGQYYVWTRQEIREILGDEPSKLFCEFYDVTNSGNWEEPFGHAPPGPKNILNIPLDLEAFAHQHQQSAAALENQLAWMRKKLLEARSRRVPPSLDDKILTDWNGLMIASLAKASAILDEPRYIQAATQAADFILRELRRDGRLLKTYRQGHADLQACLSDYAFFIEGLLNLYEVTFNSKWLLEAELLTDICRKYYYDPENGAFFFTANDAPALMVRTKNPRDGAIPSGNSVHAMNLLRLSVMLDRRDFRFQAESIFKAFHANLTQSPASFERMLCALDFYYAKPKEIVIITTHPSDHWKMLRVAHGLFCPNKVVTGRIAQPDAETPSSVSPLLRGKKAIDNRPTAYVCENFTCQASVHTPEELRKLLGN